MAPQQRPAPLRRPAAPGKPVRPAARPRPAAKRGGSLVRNILTGLLILGPLAAVALPTAVLFAVGLVPTLVALIVDKNREKYAAISVGSLNFCGVMPAAFELWTGGHSMELTIGLLSQPMHWLGMFGAAALGWAIHLAVPPLVAASIAVKTRTAIAEHKKAQDKLRDEWGDDVADGA